MSGVFTTLSPRRWTDTDGFPPWVRTVLAGDVMAPGGGLRGSPVAAHRLPDAPRFIMGWLVATGDAPVFVFRKWGGPSLFDLERIRVDEIVDRGFFRRVDLGKGADPGACLFFGSGGPSTESLRAEFLLG